MKEYILEGIDELEEDKKRVVPEKKGSGGSDRGAKASADGKPMVLSIDVGSVHDITEEHIIESLTSNCRLRREDIAKIDIRENETRVTLPGDKAIAAEKAMIANNATVDDFLVICKIVK